MIGPVMRLWAKDMVCAEIRKRVARRKAGMSRGTRLHRPEKPLKRGWIGQSSLKRVDGRDGLMNSSKVSGETQSEMRER